jgi:hypothetical protein
MRGRKENPKDNEHQKYEQLIDHAVRAGKV